MEPPPMTSLAPVLSTQEVAELLRLSDRSVLEMVKAGALPAHRAPGRRRYHFLAEEVLAAVTGHIAAAGTSDAARSAPSPRGAPPVAAPDPCDVWGAAPSRSADWPQRCVERWLELAAVAGLVVRVQVVNDIVVGRCAGTVVVDELRYLVLAGPRQRIRCVSDDGEPGWSLIDSVWVEPAQPTTDTP